MKAYLDSLLCRKLSDQTLQVAFCIPHVDEHMAYLVDV